MPKSGKAANGISSAACVLASAILHESRWKAWNSAREAVNVDPDLQGLLRRYRSLSGKLRQAGQGGEGPDGRDTLELADVTNRIKVHPLRRKEMASLDEMIDLLREVNKAISDQLGIDFASNAAPPKGSCCE